MPLGSLDTLQVKLKGFSPHGDQTRRVHSKITTTALEASRPVGSAAASPALLRRPQRSSLRRAIRDSLAAIHTHDACPVSQAEQTKSNKARSLPPVPAKNPGTGMRDRAIDDRSGQVCTRRSSNPKTRVVSHATPQRNSLRQAIRQSRHTALQSIISADTINPAQSWTSHEPLSSLDGGSDSIISLSDSSHAVSGTSIPLLEEGILETPPQIDRASSVLPCTAHQASLTATAYRPLAISHPQEGLKPELPLLVEPSTSGPSQPTSGSFLDHVPAPNVRIGSNRSKSNWNRNSHLVSLDRSIRGNPSDSRSMLNRKDWHHVREIISEAPGGLFLVEWEERDNRTGFKWPASWVKAKDISICAIQDWEKKKNKETRQQILS